MRQPSCTHFQHICSKRKFCIIQTKVWKPCEEQKSICSADFVLSKFSCGSVKNFMFAFEIEILQFVMFSFFPSERSNKVATVPKVCVYHTLNFHRLAKTLSSSHSHRRGNQANMLTCTFHLDFSQSPTWISQNLFMVFLFIAIIWYLGWCNKYMRTSRM